MAIFSSEKLIADKQQLVQYFQDGCTPSDQWKIGTEHEKFAFDNETLRPLRYSGDKGIKRLLLELTKFGWDPIFEHENPIALKRKDNSSITLEPGGQFELSGAPLATIHETCGEIAQHLEEVKSIATNLDVAFLGIGYIPKWGLSDIEWMPKQRYEIMKNYMTKKGKLGHHMMLATCTVQVNLDYSSEERMAKMFKIAMALQPLVTALWANSPFKEGKKNGYLSYRSHIWSDTDADRTGILPFVFEEDFGFEQYVNYMLDVPMYFVYRDGKYIDAAGESFRDFLEGNLASLPGEKPTLRDWENHLTTVFPEVRLKRFIEMRGADGGPWTNLCALPAFWVGLLYDEAALMEVEKYIDDWTVEEVKSLRNQVPAEALATKFRTSSLRDVAIDVLEISKNGLKTRNKLDGSGNDESHFLAPLFEIVRSGKCPAEDLLIKFDKTWNSSVEPVFREFSY